MDLLLAARNAIPAPSPDAINQERGFSPIMSLRHDELTEEVLEEETDEESQVFQVSEILRTQCEDSPNLGAMLKVVKRVVIFKNQKLVIFCRTPKAVVYVVAQLKLLELAIGHILASMSENDRSDVYAKFNDPDNEDCKILVASMLTTGIGYDLQHAAFHLLLWNQPTSEAERAQVICRVWRLGNVSNLVTVYTINLVESWEASMVDLAEQEARGIFLASMTDENQMDPVQVKGVLTSLDDAEKQSLEYQEVEDMTSTIKAWLTTFKGATENILD